jgi:hypothetical protein
MVAAGGLSNHVKLAICGWADEVGIVVLKLARAEEGEGTGGVRVMGPAEGVMGLAGRHDDGFDFAVADAASVEFGEVVEERLQQLFVGVGVGVVFVN